MTEKTVMDEVNAALGEVISDPEPETEIETPEAETPEGETPEVETPEGETPEVEAEGEEEGEPEGEVGPNGERERNPDGTWKKAEPKDEPKSKDPINDPIPKDLKKETSERIRTLIDTTKTVTAERDTIKKDFDYLVQGVQATGATPQQYGETLSWLALFNSSDPAQQEKALELVENVAERLATLLGKERTVGDPLATHADLKDAVAKGQITAKYAAEIARTRNGQQIRTDLTSAQTKEQEEQAAATKELADARTALSAWEQTMISSDPNYAAKKPILVAALKPVFTTLPPKEWLPKFQEAYRNLQLKAPAAKPKAPVNQPLRAGKQPAGGQTRQPSTMLEAVSGALGSMGK